MTEREFTEHLRLLRYVVNEAVELVMDNLRREEAALSGIDMRQADVVLRSATEQQHETEELDEITDVLGAKYEIEPVAGDIAVALYRLIRGVVRAEGRAGNDESAVQLV